jgi:hypothetical protein
MYFSENHLVCLREVEALLGSSRMVPLPNPAFAWTIINVRLLLQQVADLTDPAEQRRLGTTAQELTGDWEGYQTRTSHSSVPYPVGTAPTQDLGEALFSLPGIEGFRTLSAKVPDQRNLVVFRQKLLIREPDRVPRCGDRGGSPDHRLALAGLLGTVPGVSRSRNWSLSLSSPYPWRIRVRHVR